MTPATDTHRAVRQRSTAAQVNPSRHRGIFAHVSAQVDEAGGQERTCAVAADDAPRDLRWLLALWRRVFASSESLVIG